MKRTLIPVMLLALLVTPALAQDGTVELGPFANFIIQWVLPGAVVLIGGLVTWVVELIRRRTGLQIEQQYRDAFQTALTNAAGLALTALGGKLGGAKISINNPAVREAVSYVLRSAPDAIEKFGLKDKPQELAEKVVAKLGVVASGEVPTTPAPNP